MSLSSTASIASHYSVEQYDAYIAAHLALHASNEDKSFFAAWATQSDILQAATLAYMRDMALQGELEVVPFSDRRCLAWPDAWNRMVRQEEPGEYDDGILSEPLDACLSNTINRSASYEAFVEDIKHCRVHVSGADCELTAERIFARLDGWKPILYVAKKIDGKIHFVPLEEEAPVLGVQHVKMPMPSGELLLANWFFIDAFNKTVDGEKAGRPSLSTEAGQHALSIEYATKHGFMSVEAGNSSPDVYRQENRIIIGSKHWDSKAGNPEPQGKKIGSICTDLWWVTAIDREVLTTIVEKIDGRESAEKQVAAFIADKKHDVVTVNLPPGEPLHIYFKSDRTIGKEFDTDGAALEGFHDVFAVISPEEMEWSPVAKKKAGPKP